MLVSMLTPEKMTKFRVIVPLEHKLELLDALRAFGKVSLKTGGPERVMPSLLQEVLEGRVTPETLNIDEAERVVKQVLREHDALRKEFERYLTEYRNLQKLRRVIERLKELGVPPEALLRPGVGLSASCLCVREENLASALRDLRRLGVVVRKIKVSDTEYFLLLLYPKKLEEKVEEVKKRYMEKTMVPPDWFYGKHEEVEARIEKEERRIRKEIFAVLQEIASVIKDAIEFERASAHELFSSAYMSILEVKKRINRLEDLIVQLAAIKVARRSVEENNIDMLRALGLSGILLDYARRVFERKPLSPKDMESRLCGRDIPPEICNMLIAESERYLRFLLVLEALKYMEKEGILGKAEGLWLLLFIGEPEEMERLLADAEFGRVAVTLEEEGKEIEVIVVEGRYVNLEVFELLGFKAAAMIADDEKVFNEIQRISSRYDVIRYYMTPEDLKESEKRLAAMEENLRRASIVLLSILLLYGVKGGTVDTKRLIEASRDKKLEEIYEKLSDLKEGRVEVKLLPEDGRLEAVKEILDTAEKLLEEAGELEEDVHADLELLAGGNEKVESALLQKMERLLGEAEKVMAYEVTIEALYRAQTSLNELRIFRNRRIVIAEGYLPSRLKPLFYKILEEKVPRILYIKLRDVELGEEAPTYIEHRGILKYFYTLTEMLGTPSYWEINPTPIFTILFVTMYGMMFGDIGQGLLISLFGLWLYKTKYRLFGISEKGAQTLGALAMLSGISAAIFGAIYGCLVFLYPLCPHAALIKPLEDMMGIIVVALIFGVIQLFISFTLSTINHLRVRDYEGAIFGGTTLLGILYYAAGVYVVYKLAQHGFDLAMLGSPDVLPGVYVLLGAIFALIGYGAYKFVATKDSEYIMEALSELIEMMIAYPANSLSYIRLAAFAMAHEAFGLLAEGLVPMAGFIASYAIANFFVLAIEALAVGIQSLRLIYYEFSTKFYQGTGIPFEPLIKAEVEFEKLATK